MLALRGDSDLSCGMYQGSRHNYVFRDTLDTFGLQVAVDPHALKASKTIPWHFHSSHEYRTRDSGDYFSESILSEMMRTHDNTSLTYATVSL